MTVAGRKLLFFFASFGLGEECHVLHLAPAEMNAHEEAAAGNYYQAGKEDGQDGAK